MTEPTQARPSGSVVKEPKAYAITRYLVGLPMFAVDLYKIATEPTADWKERAFHGGLMLLAVAVLPGVAEGAAPGLKKLGAAIAPFWPFGKKPDA